MKWNNLLSIEELINIDQISEATPVLLFKHSTRCSISTMVLQRFERNYHEDAGFQPYFLDLISYRELSNTIADRYRVIHQSPQVILLKRGVAIYDASHNGISFEEIKQIAQNN